MKRGLPSKGDISKFSEAGDELDSAFDTISEDRSNAQSQGGSQLPSNDDLAAYTGAGSELDSAFDSITALDSSGNPIDSPADEKAEYEGAIDEGAEEEDDLEDVFEVDTDSYYDNLDDEDIVYEDEEDIEIAKEVVLDQPTFDFAATLAKSWHECRPYNGTSTVAQRLGRCTALAKVRDSHVATLPAAELRLRERLLEAREACTALEGLASDPKGYVKREGELKRTLATLEKEFLQGERKIATSWLRGPYLDLDLDSATKTSYFESLVLRADLSPEWWDRVTILALASGTRRNVQGVLEPLPVEELALLWNGLLPDSKMESGTILASVQFFSDAMGRLAELSSVNDLFSTGFYLDVIGYQISLRAGFFRPEILYACVDFHAALSNWLNKPEHRVLSSTREAAIANVYSDARSIFKSQFKNDEAAARLRARLRGEKIRREQAQQRAHLVKKEKYGKRARARAKARAKIRNRLILGAVSVVVLLAVGLPLMKEYGGERARDVKPMSVGAVSAIHPLLTSGGLSKPGALVLAQIDGDEWVLLSDEERAVVAQEMLEGANSEGVKNLMVYYLDLLVLEIVDGKLRYVE